MNDKYLEIEIIYRIRYDSILSFQLPAMFSFHYMDSVYKELRFRGTKKYTYKQVLLFVVWSFL